MTDAERIANLTDCFVSMHAVVEQLAKRVELLESELARRDRVAEAHARDGL